MGARHEESAAGGSMVHGGSFVFPLGARASRPPLFGLPISLSPNERRDARLPAKIGSEQVTPVRDARYAPDRPAAARWRLSLLAASSRPAGVRGSQAGCDGRPLAASQRT